MKKYFNKKTVMPYVMAAALALPASFVFIVPTLLHAEEAEPFGDDFWADFFKSLEEAGAESEKESTKKQEKSHEKETKKESSIQDKGDNVIKPAEKISTNPVELFQNPPTETIGSKGKNAIVPVKEAKNAAINIIKNFLNSIAIMEAKLNDETLREQWSMFASQFGELKVILNFIIDKNEYLSVFLAPPAEAKELKETFGKIRKQIVNLKGTIEAFNKKLTQEEDALEETKEKSLASFVKDAEKKPSQKKDKRTTKKFDIKKKRRGAKKSLKNEELLSKKPFISEE